jgi:hypothetical protein
MEHFLASGTFMEIIYILRDECELRHVICHGGDRSMSGIGLCAKHSRTPPSAAL